jgi:BMFP domain-containing protein YqiC
MVQTTNRFFDEVARLMNDAAGVAQGVRREFETLFRGQAERVLRDLDVVKREDFEAVKDMVRIAREENEALKTRVAALEATLANMPAQTPAPAVEGNEALKSRVATLETTVAGMQAQAAAPAAPPQSAPAASPPGSGYSPSVPPLGPINPGF